jgi:hypothetical protein
VSEPAVETPPGDEKLVGGVTGKGFTPGRSGNPGGRPKGLARQVRDLLSDDGESIARFWADVMANPKYDTKDRLLASRLLAERGWGKAPQYAPIEDDDPLDLSVQQQNELAADLDARLDELAEARKRRDDRAEAAAEAEVSE